RSPYHWLPRAKPEKSLRYTTILNGAVRVYKNGNSIREVCQDNPAGRREYARRLQVMVQRQNFRCALCRGRLTQATATFHHDPKRKMWSSLPGRQNHRRKGRVPTCGGALGLQLEEGLSRLPFRFADDDLAHACVSFWPISSRSFSART